MLSWLAGCSSGDDSNGDPLKDGGADISERDRASDTSPGNDAPSSEASDTEAPDGATSDANDGGTSSDANDASTADQDAAAPDAESDGAEGASTAKPARVPAALRACASKVALASNASATKPAEVRRRSVTPSRTPVWGASQGASDSCAAGTYCDVDVLTCKAGCKGDQECAAGICSSQHVCVECVPGATDTCADGKFCGPQFTCIRGCKQGTQCASGQCTASHDCAHCLSDAECQAGFVCSTGTCHATCGGQATCATDATTCCGDRCADVKRDALHCGDCGTACSAGSFCTQNGCKQAVLANVCQSRRRPSYSTFMTTTTPPRGRSRPH